MTDAGIELRNVTKQYETDTGTVRALDSVDLTVPRGAFVSIVGPSGCGKTTLLRLIAGLESPTTGHLTVDGEMITGPGPERGLVFQAATLYPWRTVAENVRLALEVSENPPTDVDKRVTELLSLVGLESRAGASPDTLSGGMQKRVGIARALAPDPEILLLDEPFSDLDVATRESLQEDLLAIWKRLDKTILVVTHTVGEAVRLSDTVVAMQGQPGSVETEVAVDIDRPRDPRTDSYKPYVNAIRETIRDGASVTVSADEHAMNSYQ